jgi:hypothetical protein
MRIGINAENLGAERFELELPGGASGAIHLVLGQSGGLTGRYEQDGSVIVLRQIAAPQLSIESLAVPLASGTLRVAGPTLLHGAQVDAELGGERPLVGRLTSASAAVHVAFERGPLLVRAGLSGRGLVFEQSGPAAQRLELESVDVEALRVELAGKAVLHVERLSMRGVRCTRAPSGVALVCAEAHAESVSIEHGGRTLRLERVALPKGLELSEGALRWPELTLERLDVKVPELKGSTSERGPARSAQAPIELAILDHLQGVLAFDLFLDVRIPILPDRRATHSIRLSVADGAIDYTQLESGLSALENMLLDFEVNEDGLILELDPIPGVKLDNVTLVTWPLSGHEHVVARTQHLVRLRRLLDYQLSPKLAGDPNRAEHSDRPSALRRLHVGNIETVLAVTGPVVQALPGLGTLRLGAPGVPAIAELRVSGQVEHEPGQPPSATEVRVDGRELALGVSIVDARGRRIEIDRLSIARIDALRVGLLGLEPRSLGLAVEGLRSGGAELRGWLGGAPAA